VWTAVGCGRADVFCEVEKDFFKGLLQTENFAARHVVPTFLLLWIKVYLNVTPYELVVTINAVSRHRELDCLRIASCNYSFSR
jgi:hypothetical protein